MILAWRTHDIPLPNADADAISMIDREWLLTNGTGAFAMGTLPGVNTRRYHALLIATTRPPVGRIAILSQLLCQVVLQRAGATQTLEFTTCGFRPQGSASGASGGAVKPTFTPVGYTLLRRFERGTSVRWTYQWGQVKLVQELQLHWGVQAATIRVHATGLDAAQSAKIRLGPLVTLRDFHNLLRKNAGATFTTTPRDNAITIRRNDAPGATPVSATLALQGPTPATFVPANDWWFNFLYPIETQRGQDDTEDAFLPGWFESAVPAGASEHRLTMTVALGDQAVEPIAEDDIARVKKLAPIAARLSSVIDETAATVSSRKGTKEADATPAVLTPAEKQGEPHPTAAALAIAADDFIARRRVQGVDYSTIIAGFPWFADWGRDTFIALPGLLLTTGRFDEARSALRVFAAFIKDGLVPNVFDDYNDQAGHYNAVDASLWYIHAAMEYVKASGDKASWSEWLAPACMSIVDAYIKGTGVERGRENEAGSPLIRMTGDGLITAGNPRTQLTWMDAARDNVVFTPRCGKAVEVNALWYHALVGLSELITDTHKSVADHYDRLASRVTRAFIKVFWNDEIGGLNDCVWTDDAGEDHVDASIRPNQVFAVSLPHSPIPRKKQEQVLTLVKNHLLTPKGLRTLAPEDARYKRRYVGNLAERDAAYHQGTVWPWLIGPYAEGLLRIGRFSDKSRAAAREAMAPLVDELLTTGTGQLHEVHDADAPHRADGTMAQAWSIAEVVRVTALAGS